MTRYLPLALLCLAACRQLPEETAADLSDLSPASCVVTGRCPRGQVCDGTTGRCFASPDNWDLTPPPPDLSPQCIYDRDCPNNPQGQIRCYKGRCLDYLDPLYCGHGTDGKGANCTEAMDPAVKCCASAFGTDDYRRARCTSIRSDALNCGMCGRKCRECRDGICIPL